MKPDLETMIDEAVGSLRRGRRGATAAAPTFVREIVPEDVPQILARPAAPPADRPMLRIRHQHHMAAKLLADGRPPAEISLITGYSTARLGQLQKDPAFAELLAHYKDQSVERWLNVHERLASLGIAVTEELMERLESAPDDFSNEELRRLAETLLDRGGYGPKSTRDVNLRSENLSVTLIEQIKSEGRSSARVDNLLEHMPDA